MFPEGLLSFPLTAFDQDDEVDLDVFAQHLDRHIAAEPAALFVACGTGEYTALSAVEYEAVVRRAVAVSAGRIPVWAGVGGGPRIAREMLGVARSAGADGVLILPPYLVRGTPAGLVAHLRYVVGDRALPAVVYQRATAVLTPTVALDLLDVPTVVGLKDGTGDIDLMARIVTAIRTSGHRRAARFGFLNGVATAELSAAAYRAIGVSDYSSASLAFVPEIATAHHRAYVAGDTGTQQRLLAAFYLPFAALRDKVDGYAVALVKAGANHRGQRLGPVRPPLVDPTPEHREQLHEIIDRALQALTVAQA